MKTKIWTLAISAALAALSAACTVPVAPATGTPGSKGGTPSSSSSKKTYSCTIANSSMIGHEREGDACMEFANYTSDESAKTMCLGNEVRAGGCVTAGSLGGCQSKSTINPPETDTTWWSVAKTPKNDAGVLTSADVQADCARQGKTYVNP